MTPAAHRPARVAGPWLALLAVALLAATGAHAGVSSDSALARTGGSCASQGSLTLLQTRSLRVYSKRGVKAACHLASGRRTVFDNRPSPCFPEICFMRQLRTAGVMVAYDLGNDGRRGSEYRLRVLNARTGRIVRSVAQGDGTAALPRREATLVALRVRSNGSIVWISDVRTEFASTMPEAQTYEVRRADTGVRDRGANELLDSSPDIDPNSLALDGANARWTRAGEPVSAPVR
jgi:hypothetical protein